MHAAIRLALLAPLLVLPGLLPAGEAAAQGMIRPPERNTGPLAPAPALPGLSSRPSLAPIPAGENASGLSPNAAMFDGIVRGDLNAVRDAVARGADLNARNALGLTPVDAAVDQGRTEIAFYLLSARDLTRGGPAPEPSPGALGAPPPDAARRAAAAAARRDAALTAAARGSARGTAQPSTPRAARLWANDGGAPQPDIGFLGFDAGRPAGAAPSAARRGGRG
jgi:hypothetical protein